MKRTCKQCGKEFNLPQSEIDFYYSKGMSLPKRCKSCRELNRKKKSDNETVGDSETISQDKTIKVLAPFGVLLALIVGWFGGRLVDTNNTYDIPTNYDTVQEVQINEEISDSYSEDITVQIQEDHVEIKQESTPSNTVIEEQTAEVPAYRFHKRVNLMEHYEKHGIDMGFDSPEAYEAAASAVVENPDSLHKLEKEDGDDVYYLESTNEFVIVSTSGFIRTYFKPDRGKAYFDKQ